MIDDFITREEVRKIAETAEDKKYKEFIQNIKNSVIYSAEHGEMVSRNFCFDFNSYNFQEFVKEIEAFGFKVEGSWNQFYLSW